MTPEEFNKCYIGTFDDIPLDAKIPSYHANPKTSRQATDPKWTCMKP